MRHSRSFMFCTLLVSVSLHAAVNDALPGDYFPLATGTSTVSVYAFDRQANGPYSNGSKLLDGHVDTQIAVLRVSHFLSLADRPVSLMAVVPWSQNVVSPTVLAGLIGRDAHGFGDIRFGATTWLLANRESGEYLGATGVLFLPTGDYDSRQVLNVGENRRKLTLNIGWIRPMGSSLILEVLPEVAWFGDNTNYAGGRNLSQDRAYAVTSYLRYRVNSSWQFHVGAQINRGGQTSINGVAQNNQPDNAREMLGATYVTDDKANQWIFRVAKDTTVKNGFGVGSEVMLRYMRIF